MPRKKVRKRVQKSRRNNYDFKVILVSFAKGDIYVYSMKKLATKALNGGGVDSVLLLTPDHIEKSEFYKQNTKILNSERGAGYWAWKPFIIKEAMKHINNGDFVLYHDGGHPAYNYTNYSFNNKVHAYCKWVSDYCNGVLPGIWQNNCNLNWCRKDCFTLTNCNEDIYKQSCQLSATFSIWKKGAPGTSEILKEWLNYCCIEDAITDVPQHKIRQEYPEFIDHRHDQAILTNLVIKHKLALPSIVHNQTSIGKFSSQRYIDVVFEDIMKSLPLYVAPNFMELSNGDRFYILSAKACMHKKMYEKALEYSYKITPNNKYYSLKIQEKCLLQLQRH